MKKRKEIILEKIEIGRGGYRERVILDVNGDALIVKEIKNVDTLRWEDVEVKRITRKEFEALKELFGEKDGK